MHKNQKNIFHFRWYKPAFSYAALRPTSSVSAGRGTAAQRLASALPLSSPFLPSSAKTHHLFPIH
jgi:hypothetical protein